MNPITLKQRKLIVIGGSKGFVVPKAYIDNGQISEDKIYTMIIEEEEVSP